jgi:hypothetical protein
LICRNALKKKKLRRCLSSFIDSPWYADIIYVLENLQAPPGMSKTKARFLKLKAVKFCILDNSLYWKDPGGILLSCLLEDDAKRAIQEFHKGDCGGHHYWKTTMHKILRAGYYWPTIFADVYKEVSSCHECQIFDGRRKLQPLPLKPISVEAPFMQWGLDFIGEINPPSSAQTQMDTHGHRLFHEMDRGDPHKASYRRSHHPIPGDKHLVKVRVSC